MRSLPFAALPLSLGLSLIISPAAIANQPSDNVTAAIVSDSRSLLQQGINAQAAGDYATAEAAYRAAINLDSEDAIGYYNLGNVLADQSRIEESIAAYQTAGQLDPTNADVQYNLGYWLNQQGEVEGAISAYREAARLSPYDADTYYNLGILLSDQSQFDEAEVMLRRALILAPDNDGGRQYLNFVLANKRQAK